MELRRSVNPKSITALPHRLRSFWDKLLNEIPFSTLAEAREKTTAWEKDSKQHRLVGCDFRAVASNFGRDRDRFQNEASSFRF